MKSKARRIWELYPAWQNATRRAGACDCTFCFERKIESMGFYGLSTTSCLADGWSKENRE